MSEAIHPTGQRPAQVRRTLALLALAGVVIALLALARLDLGVLGALPAIALAVLLTLRRYPGERILAVLSAARRPRRPRPRSSAPWGARLDAVLPRGGLLIASSLAVRPPPRARLAVI